MRIEWTWESRFVRGYVLLSTVFMGVTLASGFTKNEKPRFDELTVERINVVDKTGRTRLTLTGNLPPDRRNAYAGLLFHNNEGKEAGGLIYTGQKKDGKISAGAALTMDQYGTDQIVVLEYEEENGRRQQGLTVSDRPDSLSPQVREFFRELNKVNLPPGYGQATVDSVVRELKAKLNISQDQFSSRRVFVGRDGSRAAIVNLSDPKGRIRLRLRVDSLGTARIEFLNDSGRVVRFLADK